MRENEMADEILNFTTKSGTGSQRITRPRIFDPSHDVYNFCNSSPVRDFCFQGNEQLFYQTNRRRWLKETKGIQFSLRFFGM